MEGFKFLSLNDFAHSFFFKERKLKKMFFVIYVSYNFVICNSWIMHKSPSTLLLIVTDLNSEIMKKGKPIYFYEQLDRSCKGYAIFISCSKLLDFLFKQCCQILKIIVTSLNSSLFIVEFIRKTTITD